MTALDAVRSPQWSSDRLPTLSAAPPQPVAGSQDITLPDSACLIKPQQPLAALTTYRVGGKAEWLVLPRSPGDLRASLQWARAEGLPVTLIGAGSNLLISDRGLPGLVVCTRHLQSTQFDAESGQVTAAAGKSIVRLAWQVAERGWQGLEWAVGIPGTVGGAVVMNAGAHQGCTAEALVSTRVLTLDGQEAVMFPGELGYRYRTSRLQAPAQGTTSQIVVAATFQLQPGADPAAVTAATRHHLERRHSTQPYHLPSCGSVFRNPGPQAAGWLVEQSGLKGYRIGGAAVSPMHANFIVNVENATATDVYCLIRHVQRVVSDRWQVALEPEVKMLGEFED